MLWSKRCTYFVIQGDNYGRFLMYKRNLTTLHFYGLEIREQNNQRTLRGITSLTLSSKFETECTRSTSTASEIGLGFSNYHFCTNGEKKKTQLPAAAHRQDEVEIFCLIGQTNASWNNIARGECVYSTHTVHIHEAMCAFSPDEVVLMI